MPFPSRSVSRPTTVDWPPGPTSTTSTSRATLCESPLSLTVTLVVVPVSPLTMTGDGHTAYDGYPADGFNSECTDKNVEAYLFTLALPATGTKCKQDAEPFPAEVESLNRSAAAASKVQIQPHARPLRLPR